MKISKRGQKVPLSPFRRLLPFAEKAKLMGKTVFHVNIGQPDIVTPPEAIRTTRRQDLRILEYSPGEGLLSYRRKLADYYNTFSSGIDFSQILVTTGASEAVQLALMACCDLGDEIIVPEPFYANYSGFAHLANVHIVPLPCTIDTGFALPSVHAFEEKITSSTKAILINNPNNPTGAFYSREVLIELGKIVKKHQLYLIVDEVYREFCYDGQTFFSALSIPGLQDHVIVVDSISKRYSACGARIGALVSRNLEILSVIIRMAKLRLSAPVLGQMLGEALLELDCSYLQKIKKEYDCRRRVVYNALQKMEGVRSYLPGGAFYCFAEIPVDNAERFAQWMLEEFDYRGATVMLSLGEAFYATPGMGKQQIRIAYVLNTTALEAAMICLSEGLKKYPGKS